MKKIIKKIVIIKHPKQEDDIVTKTFNIGCCILFFIIAICLISKCS